MQSDNCSRTPPANNRLTTQDSRKDSRAKCVTPDKNGVLNINEEYLLCGHPLFILRTGRGRTCNWQVDPKAGLVCLAFSLYVTAQHRNQVLD